MGADSLFDDEFEDIEESSITVEGLDFADGPLPKVRATAEFHMALRDDFDIGSIKEWEAEHDHLDNGISFYYSIEFDTWSKES